MSVIQDPSLPSLSAQQQQQQQQQNHHRQWDPPIQTQPVHGFGNIIFTRQLWQRTMPDGNRTDDAVLNKSQAQDTRGSSHNITAGSSSRRTSSSVSSSSRSQRRSPSPSSSAGRDSKTPLTPEESPPFSRSRKRTAGIVETEDKALERPEAASPAHTRPSSGDSIHVCICQPDPKIPRPRNAFILYRQHHQARVIAENPGLSNPDISKIIGEQWQRQPQEVKAKWKELAEEEKLRHQQQYPQYRYQPKRSGRRGSLSSENASGEKARCAKCGGRTILAPSTPYNVGNFTADSPASARSPASASLVTPVTRTLPVLRDLNLHSPTTRRGGRQLPSSTMSPNHSHHDERDDLGPLSPDLKRRRFNGEHQPSSGRPMPPPRYVAAPPGIQTGPGTPFPFGPGHPHHPYLPGANAPQPVLRRESLPGLRGAISAPGPMAPPPRPGPGYQQHRMSQGHIGPHDRSLTLPPLQTNSSGNIPPPAATPVATPATAKSAKEQVLTLDFKYKINVLGQVAPPAPVRKSTPRGPLVAIEGDNPDAVQALGAWLSKTLGQGEDLNIKQIESPAVSSAGSKHQIMAQYHRLAADWLLKSEDIVDALHIKNVSPTDSVMIDASAPPSSKLKSREIDENYSDSDEPSRPSNKVVAGPDPAPSTASDRNNSDIEKMDVDTTRKASLSSKSAVSNSSSSAATGKPVSIIANFSLFASNFFSCHIPIETHARHPYSPKDHWAWTATHWRGIVGPDLTIYLRDGPAERGKPVVEVLDEGNGFVVRRGKGEGLDVEASTLRRLGFEVSEWVRGFGEGGVAE